jgi:hypothetical protein
MEAIRPASRSHAFDAATIGALAHLYRGVVYRSTIWRTRLDNTTNWAVVILGIALSVTFSSREASPLPLLLAGVLSIVFLIFEARRYRYFNVWRARARWLERNFYAPMLRGEELKADNHWTNDYARSIAASRAIISAWLAPSGEGCAAVHLDSWHSDRCLLREDRDSPGPGIKPFGVGPACQSQPNPRRANVASRHLVHRRLDRFRNDYVVS